ncbi:MBL fold metallo-hydrolase [Jannaschia sp. CCS1]|uniref:MBL fold metallo-hydrolase n=1 Tax=Jannaschia sp. (strain CCS1) TaxID=290400 RepID=UPI000053CBFB|nr:MBL fold metallo-hydrolase [Jannaschia sp. CCS1]ABD53648.1 beta-lactamase-like protein [Jannaschia sp. CCS1]
MLCKIGDVDVWRILEINGAFREATTLFPTAGDDVAAVLAAEDPGVIDTPTGRVILPVQGFLLKTPDHVVLVDACVGNHKTGSFLDWHMRSDGRFMAALTAAGVTPDDVDYVMCTHLHVDHVGWNTQLLDGRWVPTFPRARYLMPGADLRMHESLPEPHPSYTESIQPVIAAGLGEEVTADHKLGDLIDLIPTPGHTPGHVSVRIRSQGREAVITGDALHVVPQCKHPEWHFVYDADPEQAVTSRRALLETVSESGARVLGTHFQLPSIGRIKAKDDAFEWVPD